MAITYDALTTFIQRQTGNTASDFIASIPNFIRNAEQRIIRETNLPVYHYEATGTFSAGTATYALPTDVRTISSLRLTTVAGPGHLLMKHESFIEEYWPRTSLTTDPQYYALHGVASIKVAPTPGATLEYRLNYTAHPTYLSSDSDSTWLSAHAEEVLVAGTMVEAYQAMKHFGQDGSDTGVTYWEKAYARAIQSFKNERQGAGLRSEYKIGDR